MGRLPRISIVTPSFNQGHFLETTIKSVLSQEYENLEYIVIDGGSTDGSVDIIKRYADRLAYWVSEPDGGQSEAIIKGFQRSSGEIMGWLNSDDLLLSDCLSTVARTFVESPTTQMMYGNILIVDEYGHMWNDSQQFQVGFHELYYGGHIINQEATFWTRGLYERAGGLNRNLSYAMDYDLWVRMAEISHPLHVSRYLAAFRRHPSQKTTNMEPYRMEMQAIQDRTRSARGENPFAFAVKSHLWQIRLTLRRRVMKYVRVRHAEEHRELRSAVTTSCNGYIGSVVRSGHRQNGLLFCNDSWVTADTNLLRMKDLHKLRRCFIVGNGPSLNKMDLDKLKDDFVFCTNAFFLMFPRIRWRPQYYTCVDTRVLPDRATDIIAMHKAHPEMVCFFPKQVIDHATKRVTPTEEIIPPAPSRFYFNQKFPSRKNLPFSAFSLEADRYVIQPYTVTVTALQLAYLLGFEPIYLVGCDTNYVVPKTVIQEGEKTAHGQMFFTSTVDDDPNHFTPDYFGKGRKWHNPQVANMIWHYQIAHEALSSAGRHVYNATVGGKLEVFPRVKFDDLF